MQIQRQHPSSTVHQQEEGTVQDRKQTSASNQWAAKYKLNDRCNSNASSSAEIYSGITLDQPFYRAAIAQSSGVANLGRKDLASMIMFFIVTYQSKVTIWNCSLVSSGHKFQILETESNDTKCQHFTWKSLRKEQEGIGFCIRYANQRWFVLHVHTWCWAHHAL